MPFRFTVMLKRRGLRLLSEEKIALSKIRLDNAKERIAFADEILAIGDYKTVANRSYYAVFSAMRAVLALDGIDSKKHSGIIAEFQRLYIKTSIFDKELSVIIKKLFQARANSDYDDFCVISKEDTITQFHDAEKFVAIIEKYLTEIYTK